jgi:hypothetical protein
MGNSCRFELADEAKTVEEWQLDTLQVLDTGLGAKVRPGPAWQLC